MIYVTVSTRNRFWHCALTAISLANANTSGCFVHVLDDATDDDFADAKEHLFTNLAQRNLIHRYERLPTRVGFCAGRELMIERFLAQSRFHTWFHLDDDILIGQQTIQEAVRDLSRIGRGMLHTYVNPWTKWAPWFDDFGVASKIGGASYAVPKSVLVEIGNPYTGQTDGEAANAEFWKRLREAKYPMAVRVRNPHECQHTGNVESMIFGYTPKWESMYAKNLVTGKLIEVPNFPMAGLRKAVSSRHLAAYAWQCNRAVKHDVKLPAPGSETGVQKR